MGAFRDKARTVRYPEATTRVRGGYVQATGDPLYGPWFRCYYEPGEEGEQRSDAGVRRRRSGTTLYTVRRAMDGSAIAVQHDDQLDIDSLRHGRLLMNVEGTPERMPKGRVGLVIRLAKTNMASTA